MPWTTPETFTAGQTLTAASMNKVSDNASAVGPFHVGCIARTMGADNTFSNQTTYADFPNATDKAAMDLTFTKVSSSTALLVAVYATANFTSGLAQILTMGLWIGVTDYDVAQRAFPTATARENFAGTRIITGLAAGSLAVKPRFKAAGASAVTFVNGTDYVHYSIMEVMQ